MAEFFKEVNILLGLSEIASIVTAIGILIVFSKKGRAWLLKPLSEKVDKNTLDIKRQELLLLLYTSPNMIRVIEDTYSQYCKMGGNSYIHNLIEQWRASYANDVIKQKFIGQIGGD